MKNKGFIFVTVGTTKFDKLIEAFNCIELQQTIVKFGYYKIVFQIGRGTVIPISRSKLVYEYFTYKNNLKSDLNTADLVVSHAGAGTCLEVCTSSIRMLVVVNDMLMDNHQSELAEKLSNLGHCIYSNVSNLKSTFECNPSILCAGIKFSDVFTKLETDYYRNIAEDIDSLF